MERCRLNEFVRLFKCFIVLYIFIYRCLELLPLHLGSEIRKEKTVNWRGWDSSFCRAGSYSDLSLPQHLSASWPPSHSSHRWSTTRHCSLVVFGLVCFLLLVACFYAFCFGCSIESTCKGLRTANSCSLEPEESTSAAPLTTPQLREKDVCTKAQCMKQLKLNSSGIKGLQGRVSSKVNIFHKYTRLCKRHVFAD